MSQMRVQKAQNFIKLHRIDTQIAVSEKIGTFCLNGEHQVALLDLLRYESTLQQQHLIEVVWDTHCLLNIFLALSGMS